MNVPENYKYTTDHEWISIEGDIATVGITNHAQEELTDIVFVELPEMDSTFDQGDPAGVVESVKAASDIYAPISGTVTEVNTNLETDPALINTDPHGDGWIYRLRISSEEEISALLTAEAYIEHVS